MNVFDNPYFYANGTAILDSPANTAFVGNANVTVTVPFDIDLLWDQEYQLAVTHDDGTSTLENVRLSSPSGWEIVVLSSLPNEAETESFYELSKTDATVGNFIAEVGDTLAFTSSQDLVVDGQTIPTVDPAATVTGSYKWWDASANTWTPISTYTINDLGAPDVEAPVITLVGSSSVSIEQSVDTYVEEGALAVDNVDGSIPVTIGGDTVNEAVAGVYTITYDAQDAAGNDATQVTRTVTVADTIAPVISLTGSSSISIPQGTPYVEQGATWTDAVDGSGAAVVSGDTVDVNTPATYTVRYNYTDAAGNAATEVTRSVTITVVDITAPVISLNGPSTINLILNGSYNELGATWTDNLDGTGPVTDITGTVDTSTVGTYLIRYNYTDAAGNDATEVIRTVNVNDVVIINDDDLFRWIKANVAGATMNQKVLNFLESQGVDVDQLNNSFYEYLKITSVLKDHTERYRDWSGSASSTSFPYTFDITL